MLKSAAIIQCFLAVLALQGSWAFSWRTPQNNTQSVCPLQDPPTQCGAFCFSILHPMQEELTSIEGKQNLVQTKLLAVQSRLEAERVSLTSKMDAQLVALQTEMKNQVQALQSDMDIKLDSILQTVQAKLDAQLSVLQESLKNIVTKADFEERVNKTEIDPHLPFEKIGNRYFYIEHDLERTWQSAASSCRRMGGYLATPRDEQELNDLLPHLAKSKNYWIGLNDIDQEDEFVSVASGKPAPFLNWDQFQPNNLRNNQDCVYMDYGRMIDSECSDVWPFICQLDNEV
ncbi:accessory gland protein Acp29AB-like [Drosophila biarmipes]|uniref:accessory gland protein Acp29AB-like n=1 Tax=Drosophila biarmipes TaxID=125945 RepID=UPI0021CCEC20|nr:accessory gland protein Acp29AB-like [Drosophila biarmipes]